MAIEDNDNMTGRLAGKRILVVEDEYYIASDLKRALQDEHATIIGPVGQLDRGMALLDDTPIDAAVLDVNLEGAMTYPIADRLTADNVPLVFVTGYDGWAIPEAYRAVPRIAKPFATRMVLDTVERLIAAKEAA